MSLRVHLCSIPDNNIYPVLVHKEFAREEWTHRGHKQVDVEREYVQVLRYNVKHEEVLPSRLFKKKISDPFLVVTDDIDEYLRKKIPRYRN